ncbi:MAG: bacteriohemerythrin [Desulfobacteraceae bacterium]
MPAVLAAHYPNRIVTHAAEAPWRDADFIFLGGLAPGERKSSIILFSRAVFGYTDICHHKISKRPGLSMDRIEWNQALSVGVADIDEQHQRLFTIINNLIDAKKEEREPKALLNILSELVDYSDYHFRTEDNYMIENNYPLFLSHRKEHLAYINKIGSLITDFENSRESLSDDLLEFLHHWWRTHIAETDLKYARYIKANPK